ncbi:MAG: DMT family transporter [Dehalococcoidia bacterium]
MRLSPIAVLVALGCLWGTSFMFIKVIVDEISPMELVVGRLFFGAVAVLGVLAVRGFRIERDPGLIARVAGMALIANVLPFALIGWAQTRIDSGVTSVLNSSMPLWAALFAAAFLAEERFTLGRVAGLLTGLAGVAVLAGGDIIDITDGSVVGKLAVLGAAACYGLGAVYVRVLLRAQDPFALSGLQIALSVLLALPFLFAFEGVPGYDLSTKGWLALITLGLFATGIGLVAYVWLLDELGSVRGSLVVYVTPAVGLLLGWAVLSESIGLNTLVGTALILVGVWSVLQGEGPASQRVVAPAAVAD